MSSKSATLHSSASTTPATATTGIFRHQCDLLLGAVIIKSDHVRLLINLDHFDVILALAYAQIIINILFTRFARRLEKYL